MGNLSDIKRRLKSVRQIRQITGAMDTVSVARMRKAIELCANNRAYSALVESIICNFSGALQELDHMVSKSVDQKKLLIVVSSDKGLCGAFDHDIFAVADNVSDVDTIILPIGSVGGNFYGNKKNVDMRFVNCYRPDYVTACGIADEIGKFSASGNVTSISIVYSEYGCGTIGKPVVKQIFPLSVAEKTENNIVQCFEPTVSDVRAAVLPLYLTSVVYCALLNSYAAEQCARRAAMSAASDSADKLISALSSEYNRARQSAITEQIIEIIGATSALKSGVSYEKS